MKSPQAASVHLLPQNRIESSSARHFLRVLRLLSVAVTCHAAQVPSRSGLITNAGTTIHQEIEFLLQYPPSLHLDNSFLLCAIHDDRIEACLTRRQLYLTPFAHIRLNLLVISSTSYSLRCAVLRNSPNCNPDDPLSGDRF